VFDRWIRRVERLAIRAIRSGRIIGARRMGKDKDERRHHDERCDLPQWPLDAREMRQSSTYIMNLASVGAGPREVLFDTDRLEAIGQRRPVLPPLPVLRERIEVRAILRTRCSRHSKSPSP
jgi:hypothetical protein